RPGLTKSALTFVSADLARIARSVRATERGCRRQGLALVCRHPRQGPGVFGARARNRPVVEQNEDVVPVPGGDDLRGRARRPTRIRASYEGGRNGGGDVAAVRQVDLRAAVAVAIERRVIELVFEHRTVEGQRNGDVVV